MDTPGKPRIMVIDDDRHELDRTLDAIRTLGIRYEARTALGGFEALDYLLGRGRFHERGRHPLPDLILLDLGMDPLDGVAVLRVINRAEHLRHIPVVMLYKSERERERAARETADEDDPLPRSLPRERKSFFASRYSALMPSKASSASTNVVTNAKNGFQRSARRRNLAIARSRAISIES